MYEVDNRGPMDDPGLKVGILGYGYWGPNYARLLAAGFAGARLQAVADMSAARLAAAGSVQPGVKTYQDHREMLEHEALDAVIVTTPTTTHRDLAIDCLQAGAHVLVEKPIATSVADAEAMADAARRSQRQLMVGHTFLFNPAVREIKHHLDTGALGRIHYCYFHRTGLGPVREDVNALWDLAPHDISMLMYWFGKEPVEVIARGQSYLRRGTEDVVFVTLRYSDSFMASLHVSWLDPIKVRRATLVGDRKMAIFDDVSPSEKLRLYDKGVSYQPSSTDYAAFVAAVRDGDILIPHLPAQEPLREQLVHFVDCIGSGRPPIADAKHGIAVVRVLEMAQRQLEASSAARVG